MACTTVGLRGGRRRWQLREDACLAVVFVACISQLHHALLRSGCAKPFHCLRQLWIYVRRIRVLDQCKMDFRTVGF